MPTPEADAASNPAETLSTLRQKREALERAIRVASGVERLYRGLETTLLLERAPREIAHKVQSFLEHLDQETRVQPSTKLQQTLSRIEQEVLAELGNIMALADEEDRLLRNLDSALPAETNPARAILDALELFRRKAQTAVAIRLVLRERGISVAAVDLGARTAAIKQRVSALRAQEDVCRARVSLQIQEMRLSVDALLANSKLSASLRTMLVQIREGLGDNLRHLERGGTIETLPLPVEAIELGGIVEPVTPTAPAPAPVSEAPPVQRGFWRRLWRWLNSPWRKRWRDLQERD